MTLEEKQFIENFKEVYYDFEMFSKSGNKKVKELIAEAMENIFTKKELNRDKTHNYLKRVLDESYKGKNGFKEIRDTEPETHIQNHVNEALEFKGYKFRVNRFEF
tara:strand:+ start:399 stop:713 length:315 start_codon:yes stop_codon:yes gene_type:complete